MSKLRPFRIFANNLTRKSRHMEVLLEKFRKYIKDNHLATHSDKILLTVSGGVDSMVMLSLFARCGYDIGVAHCNFQLRGRESDEDEVLVAEAATGLGVPCYNKRFATAEEMERTGESMEMAARRLRYDWFAELSEQYGYTVVAIAHQADDSIETFFINLLRGTGLKGLTGISITRGRIIRPLLFASRKDIADYAIANRINFREDSSNRSTKYLRNKIRLGLVPRIREINPKFTDLMRQNIARLTDAQLFITRSIELLRSEIETHEADMNIIDTDKIDRNYPVEFVIYEMLNTPYGFKGDVVDSLCRALAAETSGRKFYSKEYVAYLDRRKILISPIKAGDACEVSVEKGAHRAYCGNSVLYMEYLDIDNISTLSQPENIALIDADKLEYPLLLRRWTEGDTFVPIGMSGHKKVSDYLIDAKVSMPEKQRQFVLLSGGRIVWVVGRRMSEEFKIDSSTENILKITKEII